MLGNGTIMRLALTVLARVFPLGNSRGQSYLRMPQTHAADGPDIRGPSWQRKLTSNLEQKKRAGHHF